MTHPRKILVVHTAFIGDVILSLPLVQTLRRSFPSCTLAFLAVPKSAPVLRNHPGITEIIEYDKRGADRGISGFVRMVRALRERRFDTAIIPHRSLRSALLARMSRIPVRIGFVTSTGRMFLTQRVPYGKDEHEITRNLSLLEPMNVRPDSEELPRLYPARDDVQRVDGLLGTISVNHDHRMLIGIAPGSVWATKRWPEDRFVRLCEGLIREGAGVLLIGGAEDRPLCERIVTAIGSAMARNLAGELTLLQSAEAIGRCHVLVSNDSAPLHMGGAVGTPTVAIFGATSPKFGFGPRGKHDRIIETNGLSCRPCAIHGGDRCPISSFECMLNISVERVVDVVLELAALRPRAGEPVRSGNRP
jgi:heptosyltransferase-2